MLKLPANTDCVSFLSESYNIYISHALGLSMELLMTPRPLGGGRTHEVGPHGTALSNLSIPSLTEDLWTYMRDCPGGEDGPGNQYGGPKQVAALHSVHCDTDSFPNTVTTRMSASIQTLFCDPCD